MSGDALPTVEPDCFSHRTFEQCPTSDYFYAEMIEAWRGKVAWQRFTIVNSEYPKPGYPDGWYFEGWAIAPWKMDPPHEVAPFNYPLTSSEPS